ncbi:MAG TPA: N-acetylmuramoyl-L-alanine amidase [Kofleriaceae bacterium]|nr:N-acetylmuramoyl-L-alanine amidase [Kofleriaceae bacterium]
MGQIWIAGTGFDVDARVVRWDEGPRFDAHQPRCLNSSQPCSGGVLPFSPKFTSSRSIRVATRPALRSLGERPSLSAAQAIIRQFVIHHDGCPTAASCFNVLHNERGLSCHFLLDNDGTIYQTVDLAFMAFHAAGFNSNSVGVELCNRGDAKRYPDFYRQRGQKRDVTTCRIHGYTYLAFDYTREQYDALKALARGLVRALPNLPAEYPQDSPGYQAWGVLSGVQRYAGLLGHYHTTTRKWDPGPFDFKKFCQTIRGRMSFPIAPQGDKADVPEDSEALRDACEQLYRKNEIEGNAGFYPLGPTGETRLWHGGVHLPAPTGTTVHAPFAGRVMVARMGGSSSAGSTNFVLLRHDMSIGPSPIRFYSLYFHLADERGGDKGAPRWMSSPEWKRGGAPGALALLDEPLEAGDLIGHVGIAGPVDLRAPQIHFEVFAADDVLGSIKGNPFQVIDGTSGGRFVTDDAILSAIDTAPRDGKVSRRELADFFHSSADRNLARYYATLNVSEWTANPSWVDALAMAPDFAGLSRQDLEQRVAEEIAPTLWWTEEVARHAHLPRDGIVYHYNPIAFVQFINQKLQEAKFLPDVSPGSQKHEDAKEQPAGVLGDIDDESGETFLDASELEDQNLRQDLTLSELADGFPE